MNATRTGLLAGLVLGLAGMTGGFSAFLVTAVVGIIGMLIGMVMDGTLDVGGMLGRGRDR